MSADLRNAALFSALALALSVAVVLLVPAPTDIMIMSTPTIAALVMMLVVTREGYTKAGWARLGLHRLGLRWWVLAAIGTALIGVFALAATLLVGQATLGASEELQASSNVPLLLVAGLGSAILLGMLEEIGWRGYLVPRLLPLGQTRALVISGLVWATWHMPFVIWFGYHSAGSRFLVLPLFYGTVAAAILFGYLRIYSGSVWPAAIAHGVHNFMWGALALITITSNPLVVEEYLGGDNGVFILLGTVAVVIWARRHYGWGESAAAGAHKEE
jgi:membrane protease YdiL (CAAX protease family)